MKTLNIPLEDSDFANLNKAKEILEKKDGKEYSWREFILNLIK